VGSEADAVVESVSARDLSPRFVLNAEYASGQLSSILAGLRAIDRPGVEAMLLTLVDVPLVRVATVDAVLKRFREVRAPIVRPVHGSLHGHPVLIGRTLFDRLRSADPATGAKPIVRAYASEAGDVTVTDDGAFTDVDTPEDYSRFFERSDARR
jgi:molybdenum cofactor cytidylyltransferase